MEGNEKLQHFEILGCCSLLLQHINTTKKSAFL
jgi:hypothetical protein